MLNIYAIKNAIIFANKETFQDSSESFLHTSENINVDLNENPDFIKVWYGKIYDEWLEPIIEKDIDRKSDNAKIIALAHKINSHKTCKREKIYKLLSWLSSDNTSNDNEKTTLEDELLALANNIKKVMYTHYQETTKHVVSMQQVDAFARVILHSITDSIDVIDTDSDGFIDERTSLFEIGLFPEDGVNLYRKLALLSIIALIPIDPRSKDNKKAIRHFSTAYKFLLPEPSSVSLVDSNHLSIDKDAVWNAGKQWYEQTKKEGNRFSQLIPNEDILPLVELVYDEITKDTQKLSEVINNTSDHLYLIGEGGIGKTTSLFNIIEGAYKGKTKPITNGIPIYVELSRANNYASYSNGSSYILRSIQELLPQSLGNYSDWEKQLIDLLSKRQGEKQEFTLLLDGLNEVSRENKNNISIIDMLSMEIRHIITHYENVRVILTSRSKESSLGGMAKTLFLSGIGQEDVKKFLESKNFSEKKIEKIISNKALMEILSIPLFLTYFAETDVINNLLTRGEILHTFFTKIKTDKYTERSRSTQIRENLLNEKSEIYGVPPSMLSFILEFILPEIAWSMVKNSKYQITSKEIIEPIKRVLTSESDTDYCGGPGRKFFEEYHDESDSSADTLGEAEKIIRYFSQAEENEQRKWERISTKICDYLIMQLRVLQRVSYGECEMSHEHIRDYFAALYHINKLKLAVYLFNNKEMNEDYRRAQARLCLSEWSEPLPSQVLTFMGEALGEAHNAPHYEMTTNRWINTVSLLNKEEYPERTLVRRGLEIFRDKTDKFENNDSQAVWNLFQILKLVRRDLSGEDFSNLDLSVCCARGYCLGNKDFGAKLTGSILTDAFFLPATSYKVSSAGFSLPDGKQIVLSLENGTVKILDSNSFDVLGTLDGHSPQYSPDGKHIVTLSLDESTIIVWDAKTFDKLGTLDGLFSQFSPDGIHIVTVSRDDEVKVWDTDTCVEIGTLYGTSLYMRSRSLPQYSPDGNNIVTYSIIGTIDVWNAKTLERYRALPGISSQFSPNGERIVTVSFNKRTTSVWDAKTFVKLGTLDGHSPLYSPDGKRIVTVSFNKRTTSVWDAKTFVKLGTLDGHSPLYSPDGRHIVTFWLHERDTTIVWDAKTFVKLGTLEGHSPLYSPSGKHIITDLDCKTAIVWNAKTFIRLGTLEGKQPRYSPDEQRIITVSDAGITKVWDANTFEEIIKINDNSSKYYAQYNCDGKYIVTASLDERKTSIWDAKTFIKLGALDGEFDQYSPDGKCIITDSWGEKPTSVWDAEKFIKLGTLEGKQPRYSPDGKHIVTFWHHERDTTIVWDAKTFIKLGALDGEFDQYSPDGKCIVTDSWGEKPTSVWDAEKFIKLGTLEGHFPRYSPDGKHIVTDSYPEGQTGVWDARKFIKLGTIEGRYPRYSPDGKHIVTLSLHESTIIVWDAKTFKKLGTLDGCFFRYSPDGKCIVTFWLHERDTTIVWDAKTFKKLEILDGRFFRYSPDGKRIVTGFGIDPISVWDAKSFIKLGSLDGRKPRYSPDGKYIVTVFFDGITKIWDADTFKEAHTIHSLFGLDACNVDARILSSFSSISSNTLNLLKENGVIIHDRDSDKQSTRDGNDRSR